jgi:hypothetical protein
MKVVIFGASVSAQTVRHGTDEVTGYSEVLRRRKMAALGATSLKQICYPGGRLSDGGLYRVGHVIGHMPDLCLFEPLAEDTARGRSATPDEVEFVYRSLLRRRILPVVVLLPEPAKGSPRRWDGYDLHTELCSRLGLPTIEVDVSDVEDPSSHFTGLHTKLPGAELYADRIVRGLQALGDRRALADLAFTAGESMPARLHESVIPVPPANRVNHIALRLSPRTPTAYRSRIVQVQRIGPFSPVISVEHDGASCSAVELRSVWDPYCHYEREAYPVLADVVDEAGSARSVAMRLSEADPPYETSRRTVDGWPGPRDRSLRPMGPIKVFSTVPMDVQLLRYD